MRKSKAISWEKISEGILTSSEIQLLEDKKQPITMAMTDTTGTKTISVQIVPNTRPSANFNVLSQGVRINPKPYKYLSCAVRCAVKEYKRIIRTGMWKCLVKA